VGWGAAEAASLRTRVHELPLRELPATLDGLTVLHVSDVHAGIGPGLRMLRAAAAWADELRPDIVALTGDLVARRRSTGAFEAAAASLATTARLGAYAVFGNHDVAEGRDPFAQGHDLRHVEGFELLEADVRVLETPEGRISITGASGQPRPPSGYDYTEPRDHDADLRILLCHYPVVLERLPPGAYHLVLSGHLHGGQICLPGPNGLVGLAHPRARYRKGVYEREGTVMHVSPGLGTTFVPLRFLSPPEATLLVLHATPVAPGVHAPEPHAAESMVPPS
jgi:predicted MPP superfamily phosphohydrolase